MGCWALWRLALTGVVGVVGKVGLGCGTRVFVRLSGVDATHIRRRQSHPPTGKPTRPAQAEPVRPTLR